MLTSEKINKIEEKNLLSKQKITTANNFYDQKEYLRCESEYLLLKLHKIN